MAHLQGSLRPLRRPCTLLAPTFRPALFTAAILLACTLLLRLRQFGDPIIGLDEQFYLLVGDRIWQGAIPYIDIWDRKPAGLFLIYAAIRALPSDGIIAYQIVASLCVAGTGFVVAGIARRTMPFAAALVAGLATILYTIMLGDGFGEAPVFYDGLTAGAAWCVLRSRDGGVRSAWPASVAMLLCGLALTVKTVAVFESCAFGILLLAGHLRAGLSARQVAIRGVRYAILGALPMLAIVAFYASHGAFAAFWFANVVSIGLRSGALTAATVVLPFALLILLGPLVILALIGPRDRSETLGSDRPVLLAWLGATLVGYLAVGFFFFHYAIPMLASLTILAAAALRGRNRATCAALVLMAVPVVGGALGPYAGVREDRRQLAALLAALPPDVTTHCLFIAEGPAILYHLSHACLASPYAFPGHIAAPEEVGALGQPRGDIVRAAFARRPAAVLTKQYPADPALLAGLSHGYRPSTPLPIRLFGGTRVLLVVWRRQE